MLEDMTEGSEGVLISDGRSSIRLTRDGQPNELGYPTIVDVCAGPFRGAVRDNLLDFGVFRTQLAQLYENLRGDAKLGSYEDFELHLNGDGTGGIWVRVNVIGDHVAPIHLKFGFGIDQSYLPPIIQQIDSEFPAPYRAF
jgi:hypothetical protein